MARVHQALQKLPVIRGGGFGPASARSSVSCSEDATKASVCLPDVGVLRIGPALHWLDAALATSAERTARKGKAKAASVVCFCL